MLAIVSGVLLVLFFAKLDQLISLKYQRTFEVKLPFLRFFRPCFPSYDFPLICSCCFSLCYFEFFQEDISRGRLTSMAGVIGCNFFPFLSHPKFYIHIWLCRFVVFKRLFYSSGNYGEHLGHYRRQRGSVEKVLIVAHNHPPKTALPFQHLWKLVELDKYCISIRSQDPNNSSDTERGPCLASQPSNHHIQP